MRLWCFFVLLSDQRARVISGQGWTYFYKSTCTQHDPSELQDPGQKTTWPTQLSCCVCVCKLENKPVFFSHLLQITYDADQTVLGIEHPKIGMFTLDKSNGKNSHVVSAAAHKHAHTCAHPNHPFMVI